MTEEHKIPGRILREMQIISDQQGIMERYLAEAEGWKEHLTRTRNYILESVSRIKPGSVLVCGSGWLLDLPLEELSAACREVYLADIHHPVQIRRKIERLSNCRLMSIDLTGGAIQGAYYFVKQYRKTGTRQALSAIPVSVPTLPINPDLIISLNLLNQMDILLVDYIQLYLKLEEKECADFRMRIQRSHLDFLATARACLISDTEERFINREGQEIESKKLIYAGFPEGSRQESWIWRFDESGNYKRGMKTHMFVQAVEL